MSESIEERIEKILAYGIDVETKSEEEEEQFRRSLLTFYNENTIYKAFYDDGLVTVTDDYFQPLVQMEVLDSLLTIDLVDPDMFFGPFYELLRFIKELIGVKEALKPPPKEQPKVNDEDLEWL